LHDLAHAGPDGMIADTLVAIAGQPQQVGAQHFGKPPESPIAPADRFTERGGGREVDPIVGVDQSGLMSTTMPAPSAARRK